MSEQLRESLSALMDGEASAFEVRRVLDEVRRDAQLQRTWVRWRRLSGALQGGATPSESDLADRVWAGSRDDPATAREGLAPLRHQRSWGRVTAWVAASAVAVAVIVATNLTSLGGGEGPSAPQVAALPVAPSPPRPVVSRPSLAEPNVNVYMIQHMQQKVVNQPDVGAFTKLVTFEPDPSAPPNR
ncbi:MAG: sigma-E factor negative regulatory protein [Gammaproteobacteria bacterium]|nr:sigma-E factor negative regulatory protein [Gammaproteobacteria bacterium]MDE0269607.1 sigma-E factor negative regulatory protein [Gammaproteobacteria bacterium]